MIRRFFIPVVMVSLCAGRVACAESMARVPGGLAVTSLELNLAAALPAQVADAAPAPEPASPDTPSYGAKDSWRWYVQGAWGIDVKSSDNQFVLLGGGVSYFLVDYVSLSFELNGMYFTQTPGSDAFGINVAMLLRWHFIVRDKWTVFADIGAGLLGTTESVPGPQPAEPRGGTKFNFTPQAGVGFTYALNQDMRLIGGVRWHHISNANLQENNPGRDSIMLYVGVSLPF